MDIDFYKGVIEECFPQVRVSDIRFLGGGSCRVFEVNNELIFRFPHGSNVEEAIRKEKRLYDQLYRAFSFTIPHYEYFSNDCASLNKPVAGYKKIGGIELSQCRLSNSQLKKLSSQIAKLLSQIHSFPVEKAMDLGFPYFSPSSQRANFSRSYNDEVKDKLFPMLTTQGQDWVRELFEEFLSNDRNFDFEPVLTHGDFDSSNILYDQEREEISGIIDFEDAVIEDPTRDLCVLVDEFGKEFVQDILADYEGVVDDGLQRRISFRSKQVVFIEIFYGLEFNEPEFTENGLKRLRRAMNDSDIIGGWLQKSTSETRYQNGFPP